MSKLLDAGLTARHVKRESSSGRIRSLNKFQLDTHQGDGQPVLGSLYVFLQAHIVQVHAGFDRIHILIL
ncbi:hypothetical protein M378DRAFT_171827 [Amanita muscaria Koide BX008]|uniref:Uncharacterized protein n=1 Tax=Amanita muscaria (strain Koide BX008) TaxID=946122 RepID=A0A0C2WL29_AMAMK|nr:hypothetical protein M378DRAFT_171827 [Amanita muscaria Koide BX008]